ncbi:MAG: acetyl-CoA carboxylase carboxyl transferase subunit alpha, partial [Gemmatimonadota bacterium]
AEVLREAIRRHLTDLDKLSAEQLVETRRAKYYAMGAWEEPGADG